MFTLETARDVFAVIGLGFCLWQVALWFGRGLGWIERFEIERQKAEAKAEREAARAAPAPAAAQDAIPAAHVAAIAGAVAAMGGGLRLVMIEDPAAGHNWAAEGRWLHQTSHRAH